MRRLIKHIEQLLYRQECVVVPGLGAFILHTEESYKDNAKGLIYPSRTRLSFNAALNQNDGLLVQSYSEAFSFGYKRSLALLESDVQEVKQKLLSSGVVSLGQIGKLTQDRVGGGIRFLPNEEHPFSVQYYGLQPVSILPRLTEIAATESKPPRRQGDIYYVPVNLKHLAYGTSAAALLALALLIPSNRQAAPQQSEQYQAGFLASQPKLPKILSHEQEPEQITVAEETPRIGELSIYTPAEEKVQYYVIVATLSGESQAVTYIERTPELADFSSQGGILISSTGLHRVFADRFDTIEEAQDYLRELSKNPDYSTAWIHKH